MFAVLRELQFFGFLHSFISTVIMLPFTCIAFLLLAILYCIVTSVLLVFKLCTSRGRAGVMGAQRGTGGGTEAGLARPAGATNVHGPRTVTVEQGQEAQAGNDSSGEHNTDLNSDVLREIAAIFNMEAGDIFTDDEEASADTSSEHLEAESLRIGSTDV